MKKIATIALLLGPLTSNSTAIAQSSPPAELSFLEGVWSDNCILAIQLKRNVTFIKWDAARGVFVRDYRSYLGDGRYHAPIVSDVTFSLTGDNLIEADGSTTSYYVVSNTDSTALYNLNDPDAANAPAMRMTELHINGNVLKSKNVFRKCLNN